MSFADALSVTRATLGTSLRLYARHFGALTLIALVPAALRIGYFLFASGSPGSAVALVESVVGLFRLLLLFAAFRIVWPGGFAASTRGGRAEKGRAAGAATRQPALSRPTWQEVACLALATAAFFAVINWLADILGGAIASHFAQGRLEVANLSLEPSLPVHEAARYGLKNLFVIPLWVVHLLVAIRTLFFKDRGLTWR